MTIHETLSNYKDKALTFKTIWTNLQLKQDHIMQENFRRWVHLTRSSEFNGPNLGPAHVNGNDWPNSIPPKHFLCPHIGICEVEKYRGSWVVVFKFVTKSDFWTVLIRNNKSLETATLLVLLLIMVIQGKQKQKQIKLCHHASKNNKKK